MAGAQRFEVKGAANLQRTLDDAARELGDLSGPGEDAGALVASRASGLAPRLTGALASSITVDAGPLEVVISSPLATYPAIQEYGSRYVTARPFMRPALDERQDLVVDRYSRAVDAALTHVKGA